MDWMLSDNRKIGGFMLCFGILFMFLGVIFFFDKALLALGNILFLSVRYPSFVHSHIPTNLKNLFSWYSVSSTPSPLRHTLTHHDSTFIEHISPSLVTHVHTLNHSQFVHISQATQFYQFAHRTSQYTNIQRSNHTGVSSYDWILKDTQVLQSVEERNGETQGYYLFLLWYSFGSVRMAHDRYPRRGVRSVCTFISHTHTHKQKNRYGIFKLFGSFFPIMIKSIQGFISSIFGTESSLLRKMGGIKESGVWNVVFCCLSSDDVLRTIIILKL